MLNSGGIMSLGPLSLCPASRFSYAGVAKELLLNQKRMQVLMHKGIWLYNALQSGDLEVERNRHQCVCVKALELTGACIC